MGSRAICRGWLPSRGGGGWFCCRMPARRTERRRRGARSRSFSPAVAYSFYPTKNLPCLGDGGAVLTDSRAVAEKLRRLRDGGRRNDQVAPHARHQFASG